MKKTFALVLAAGWALAALGCNGNEPKPAAPAGPGARSPVEKEFRELYKQYSARFHDKMVTSAQTMQPDQITAEAARIWDEVFGKHTDLLKQRVEEALNDLDAAPPIKEGSEKVQVKTGDKVEEKSVPVYTTGNIEYIEVRTATRVEPGPDQPKGIIPKQFYWNPIGAAQMDLNTWLAQQMKENYAIRSLLTANAALFWEAIDRSVDKPKLLQRQGPLLFIVELTRLDDYYQVDRVRWLRPKAMGPLVQTTAEGAQPPSGTTPPAPGTPPPATTPPATTPPAEKPAEKPAK